MNKWWSRVVLMLAMSAVVMLLASAAGTRTGWWAFPVGFQLMRAAVFLGIAAFGGALIGVLLPAVRATQGGRLVVALALGVGVVAIPAYWLHAARSVPPIHDISTDLDDPPAFVAVVPLRADAPNPVDHGGAAVAEAQRRAYPDIQPKAVAAAPIEVFTWALGAARDMGWEVVDEDPAAGRIEATATTFWFGFRDDIVVRVSPDGPGSRIDVRSKSRVGRSDLGANAKRIRDYLDRVESAASEALPMQ